MDRAHGGRYLGGRSAPLPDSLLPGAALTASPSGETQGRRQSGARSVKPQAHTADTAAGTSRRWRNALWILLAGAGACLTLAASYAFITFDWSVLGPRGQTDIAFDLAPAGDRIVFTAAGGGFRDVYLLDLRSSRIERLTQTPEYESDPAFSPDGRTIAYSSAARLGLASHLFLRVLNSPLAQQLTRGDGTSDRFAAFSPDGASIVFTRAHIRGLRGMGGYAWYDWDLYSIRRDGSQLKRLTH